MDKRLSATLIGLILLDLLACQAAGNILNPFATATPTSSPTLKPTQTSIPTATATLTSTPLPTGTMKQVQPGGTTVFTDYDYKYEIVFPVGWTAINLNSNDLNSMIGSNSNQNPQFAQALALLKAMDPKSFRIFAFDFRPGHIINSFTPNINDVIQNNDIVNAMSLQNLVDATTQSLPQMIPGTKVISSKMTTTISNIPIGVVEVRSSIKAGTGSQSPVYEKLVIIKLPEAVMTLTMATLPDIQSELLPEFQEVIDSLKILE